MSERIEISRKQKLHAHGDLEEAEAVHSTVSIEMELHQQESAALESQSEQATEDSDEELSSMSPVSAPGSILEVGIWPDETHESDALNSLRRDKDEASVEGSERDLIDSMPEMSLISDDNGDLLELLEETEVSALQLLPKIAPVVSRPTPFSLPSAEDDSLSLIISPVTQSPEHDLDSDLDESDKENWHQTREAAQSVPPPATETGAEYVKNASTAQITGPAVASLEASSTVDLWPAILDALHARQSMPVTYYGVEGEEPTDTPLSDDGQSPLAFLTNETAIQDDVPNGQMWQQFVPNDNDILDLIDAEEEHDIMLRASEPAPAVLPHLQPNQTSNEMVSDRILSPKSKGSVELQIKPSKRFSNRQEDCQMDQFQPEHHLGEKSTFFIFLFMALFLAAVGMLLYARHYKLHHISGLQDIGTDSGSVLEEEDNETHETGQGRWIHAVASVADLSYFDAREQDSPVISPRNPKRTTEFQTPSKWIQLLGKMPLIHNNNPAFVCREMERPNSTHSVLHHNRR